MALIQRYSLPKWEKVILATIRVQSDPMIFTQLTFKCWTVSFLQSIIGFYVFFSLFCVIRKTFDISLLINVHSFQHLYFVRINFQLVHSTSGESLAELYHGSAVSSQFEFTLHNWITMFISTILIFSRYIQTNDVSNTVNILNSEYRKKCSS